MTIKEIKIMLQEGESLKILAQSYSELASVKLKQIRSNVERNREFLAEISSVYNLIKVIAATNHITLPNKNNKTLSLILTSNYRFYGNINNDLVLYFLIQTSKFNCDRMIVGSTGKEYLDAMKYFHKYEFVEFEKDMPNSADLKQLAAKLSSYTQVVVFHSQFQSVLMQKPKFVDITQFVANLASSHDKPVNVAQDFILEPEIGKMLEFFESQIMVLLLEQTFLESELARTASRLISMDQAESNAGDFIKLQKKNLGSAKRTIINARLLETISSIAKFRSENYSN